ncbi:DUF6087 family protein [Streptomyces sp. NPDC091292]|uniref:DUF6087 family protein n=1 Tax=Streptomyces sp. NPDC091292 TaxID=3365991 RepID=UPI00380C6A22
MLTCTNRSHWKTEHDVAEERRQAAKGKRRALPLTEGPHHGRHGDPNAPHLIQEWNETEWGSSVDDLAEAKKPHTRSTFIGFAFS